MQAGSVRPLTLFEFANGDHAVIGRQLPDPQSFVVADCGADRKQRMSRQSPHLPLHVTLNTTHSNEHDAVPVAASCKCAVVGHV